MCAGAGSERCGAARLGSHGAAAANRLRRLTQLPVPLPARCQHGEGRAGGPGNSRRAACAQAASGAALGHPASFSFFLPRFPPTAGGLPSQKRHSVAFYLSLPKRAVARCQRSAQQPGLLSSPLSEGIRSRGGGILCVAHRGTGAEALRQVQGCALRAPAPCAFLKWRGRHLGAGRFQGNRSKKDVISFTFLDLEAASQETKGSVEVGEAAVLPKWILLTFSATSVCVGCVCLFSIFII